MSPERVADLVARWVRLYTRSLPAPVAERRAAEIEADLHDHIAHERAHGVGERRIALAIASRMVRGLAADASWRGRHRGRPARRPAVRVGLVTVAILLIPFTGMQFSDGVDWGAADFVLAGILIAGSGLLLELAVRRPRNVAHRAVAVAVGAAAIVLGEADDAPGLVGFGCLLVLGAVALTIRAARRSA